MIGQFKQTLMSDVNVTWSRTMTLFNIVLILLVVLGVAEASLESVKIPELVEFGKLYGEEGGNVESNVIGYTFMINRNGAPVNATWARALPNPDNNHYTYQPLTGDEANITINTEVDEAFDVINTNLEFNNSKYNNLSQIQFVLRLSMDYQRGPVDLFLFANNPNLHVVPLPIVHLPQSSTYLVPLNQVDNDTDTDTDRPVDIVHEVKIVIPDLTSAPLQVSPTFTRVYEEFRPTGYIAGDDDYFLVIPKHPDQEQDKYKYWSRRYSNGSNSVRQRFLVENAFKNDSGLYQFDVKVESIEGPVYEISTPFLLRRYNYSKYYEHALPCSPYRRDTTSLWLPNIGFVEGTLPCVRYLAIGQNYEKANMRVRFIGDDFNKLQPQALNNDKQGLYDLKDRFFIVNNPDDYLPWDEDDSDLSVAIKSQVKSGNYRQTSFRFQPYKPVTLANIPNQVIGNQVRFECNATNAKVVKVAKLSDELYSTLNDGMRYVNIHELKYVRNLRSNSYRGIDEVKSFKTDGVVSSIVVKFNRDNMHKLYENNNTVACIAYNSMDIKTIQLYNYY